MLREELLEGGRGVKELQKEEADLVAKAIKDSKMVEDEAVCKASVVVNIILDLIGSECYQHFSGMHTCFCLPTMVAAAGYP